MAVKAEAASKELTKNDKIKLGVAGGIFLIAAVWMTHSLGLWGGDDTAIKPVVETPQEQEAKQQMIQQAQKEREAMQARPGTVKAGE